MKRLASLFFIVPCIFLSACGNLYSIGSTNINASNSDDSKVKTKILRLAFAQTESHPQYIVMQEFSDNFKEATNGKYEIRLFPNETLGSQREAFEQCQTGIINLAIVSNTYTGSVSDYYKAFDMPFIFNNVSESINFIRTNPVMDEVKSSVEPYGIKIAEYLTAGVRSMYTHKPIHTVADMKGMKIRTMESDIYIKMMNLFKASASPMSMGELYTAMQSGVVDGAENNEVTYVNSKHYEVAPFWSQTDHLIVPDWLIVNKETYDNFTPEEKIIFDEECMKAADRVNELWGKEVDSLMASLPDTISVTSDVDIQSFKDAVQPLYDELTSKNSEIKKVYDAILESQ